MTEAYAKLQKRIDEKNTFKMMELPTEVRRHLLGYLVEKDYLPVFLGGRHGSQTGMLLPKITYVNKKLRLEVIVTVIENTTFSVHSGPGNAKYQKWLGGIDLSPISSNYVNGFGALKQIEFPYFSRFRHQVYAINNDVELMLKCKNLQVVTMEWVWAELIDETHGAKTVQQVRAQYQLDRMRTLRNLKKIVLRRRGYDTVAENVLQQLAAWFRASIHDGTAAQNPPDVVIV